jgi:hypothetical protein
VDVELELLRPGDPGSSIDLSVSGNAGAHVETAALPRRVAADIAHVEGTRADEAHIAAQHIPKLRQFIEATAPQEGAKPCAALRFGTDTWRGNRHVQQSPEFQNDEGASLQAGTLLPEKHWRTETNTNEECDSQHGGPAQSEQHEGGGHVERALGMQSDSVALKGDGHVHTFIDSAAVA